MDLPGKSSQFPRVQTAICTDVHRHGVIGNNLVEIGELPLRRFGTLHEVPLQPDRGKRILHQLLDLLLCVHRRLPSCCARFLSGRREVLGADNAVHPAAPLDPVIDILYANDVVFAEIGARLDLDQVERDLSGIFETVHAAQRDENQLVFAQQDFFVVARDNRGAVHHDPMLGAVIMLLERQLGARIDGDALDLKPLAGMDRLMIAPGAMHALGLGRGPVAVRLETFDQLSDILITFTAGHQHHVGRGGDQ